MPPGADFPAALVAGLVARMAGQPPEALARVTLYLNTSRMLRRVQSVFDDHGPAFLPRLRLVSDIGQDPLCGLPPAEPAIRRRLELAGLVAGLLKHRADFAPGSNAYDLADSLAALMAEMHDEGVAPDALERPGIDDSLAAHWAESLRFVRIVARYFDHAAPPDAEARQRRAVEAMIAGWSEAPPSDPIIVAGSTGSRGTAALLMRAVAGLPQGAVILPGYDFNMPDEAWNSLYSGGVPAEDHPQFRFVKLLKSLELRPSDVDRWAKVPQADAARARLVSLALRPAPVTDQWMAEGALLGPLEPATRHLTLIESPTPRAESLAIALCLRKAAEDGRRAALVTPDRTLARRVMAALDRWSILPDESAGEPLGQTAPGRFLRHIAGMMGRRAGAEDLLTVLKHPLTATGAGPEGRGEHLRLTRNLELTLRRQGPAFPEGQDILAWAATAGEGASDWATWLAHWLDRLADPSQERLQSVVTRHLDIAEAIAAGPGTSPQDSELWQEEAGRTAAATMAELQREAAAGGSVAPAEYARLLSTHLGDAMVHPIRDTHPLISVWGTLEARVQGADLIILAGLNEGVWPAAPAPDPWLSRQMRMAAGLLLPERQIGLSAHDFQQAAAAPEVILSRACRDAEAETVPSRWLARLTNLLNGLPAGGGPDACAAMRARGDVWLQHAVALEQPPEALAAALPPAARPAPRPPVAARPRTLAVTGIRTLIRDPYAIYARHILRLRPLNPLRAGPDPRLRGQVLHEIVEHFVREGPVDETADVAAQRLLALAEATLKDAIPWPSAQRIWLARIARIADRFGQAEAARRARGVPAVLEEKGSITLENGSFTLTARPDRIDLLDDGRVHIYDYKSGTPPTEKQQKNFDMQLLLEAIMAERGGFAGLGPRSVEAVSYIQLGGEGAEKTTAIEGDLLAGVWSKLERLIAAYDRRQTGYAARRAVFEARQEGDYDHLARFGEWQMSDPPVPEDVG
ncbi:MAG: double-strand break repair protein AddB [Paracoccaceae bacterium]